MPKVKRLVVGLTGGLGSGKSTVLKAFKGLGARTFDADAVSRAVVEPGGPAYGAVRRLFGPSVLKPDGALDRKAVAARVFARPALRKRLERIIHPLVRREMKRAIAAARRGVLVLDVPLLFESRLDGLVDRVCVVWAPEKVRVARLLKSGRFTAPDIRRRLRSQMSLDEKRRRADDVVVNDASLPRLRAQAKRLWSVWKAL